MEEELRKLINELAKQKFVPANSDMAKGWNQGVNMCTAELRKFLKKIKDNTEG